jgi:hypothetical protein
MVTAVLGSTTALLPLLDVNVHLELRAESGGPVQILPVQLSASQLVEKQAVIAVVPRRLPRRVETWLATWIAGDRPLATLRARGISRRQFHRSLQLVDTRFVVEPVEGKARVSRHLPPLRELTRAGPCFLVTSREPGMAGFASFQVRAQVPNAVQPPMLCDEDVLITDGPTLVAPGTVDASEMAQINGFELRLQEETLGMLSTSPIPVANFTSEGGFRPAHEFTWTSAADEELSDRLNRLLEDRGHSK